MNILVLNCGSSTVKFQVIQTDLELISKNAERCLASGNLEKIGSEQALVTMKATGHEPTKAVQPLADHREAIDVILKWIVSPQAQIEGVAQLSDIDAVGHRVVHGGEDFAESVLVNDAVLEKIRECAVLAPLHNPANLKGIEACRDLLGAQVPQVVVFDTAFHSTLPPEVYIYGIPYEIYTKYKVRRYGFHGTSHRYIAGRFAELKGIKPEQVNIVCLHLGNGCSACAIKNGKSIDTSMGFTPLEGLLMGTRCGDVDASVVPFLCDKAGMTVKEVDTLMNKQSGLQGLAGMSDMRDLEAAEASGDKQAAMAMKKFCLRVKKYVGSYIAEMGGCDAVVFTGGVGQNSDIVRRRVCEDLEYMGLEFDDEKNVNLSRGSAGRVSKDGSKIEVWALPTNEELMIARDTVHCVCGK